MASDTLTDHGKAQPRAGHEAVYELVSGGSGLVLALFMWGHMFFVGSILLGTRGFDWVATMMERAYVAQPTVLLIFLLFVVHAVTAARKIPLRLRERRAFLNRVKSLAATPKQWAGVDGKHSPATFSESALWPWQVVTGLVVLVLGSFHLILMMVDVFTAQFGDRVGIEAATSMARTGDGLVWLYGALLICVEFHAGVGLFRLAIKWTGGAVISRTALRRGESLLFWCFLVLGLIVLAVLAGWLAPPLAFLLT